MRQICCYLCAEKKQKYWIKWYVKPWHRNLYQKMRKLFFFLIPNFSSARGSFQSDLESDENFPETFTESVYLADDSLQSRGNYRGNNNRPKVVEDPSTIIFWDTNLWEFLLSPFYENPSVITKLAFEQRIFLFMRHFDPGTDVPRMEVNNMEAFFFKILIDGKSMSENIQFKEFSTTLAPSTTDTSKTKKISELLTLGDPLASWKNYIHYFILRFKYPVVVWSKMLFPYLEEYHIWRHFEKENKHIDKNDLHAMFHDILNAVNKEDEYAPVHEPVETQTTSLIFEIEDEEEERLAFPQMQESGVRMGSYNAVYSASRTTKVFSTTPTATMSASSSTATITQAFTTKTNFDNFKESLFFSTKTIVGLDLEWKNDFSDRNTNAFFEIEKNISNAFLAIRRKGKNF